MIRTGRVTGFHPDRGLGTLRAEDGAELPFHCTAIADGSRTIQVGTTVVFETEPGLGGRWWATSILTVRLPGES